MCWRQTGGARKNKRRAYYGWVFSAQAYSGFNTISVPNE